MTRPILSGLLGLLSVVAMASLPSACESGGVGDPCLPEEEYDPQFAGFKVTEENIESRSFQCQTRICLVNHFQGRVSCPLGQEAPTGCDPTNDEKCARNECKESGTYAPDCNPQEANSCIRGTCDPKGSYCRCETEADCPGTREDGWICDVENGGQCKLFLCRTGFNGCQDPTKPAAENEGKSCCVPGTENAVAAPVCGQCAANSDRNAEQAVYCSCRCGPAEGDKDPNFNFCECPQGFECQEIRPNIGLGDEKITGKYCVKQGSVFQNEQSCGQVQGRYNSEQCEGTP